jgi:hypothetical protein
MEVNNLTNSRLRGGDEIYQNSEPFRFYFDRKIDNSKQLVFKNKLNRFSFYPAI